MSKIMAEDMLGASAVLFFICFLTVKFLKFSISDEEQNKFNDVDNAIKMIAYHKGSNENKFD